MPLKPSLRMFSASEVSVAVIGFDLVTRRFLCSSTVVSECFRAAARASRTDGKMAERKIMVPWKIIGFSSSVNFPVNEILSDKVALAVYKNIGV